MLNPCAWDHLADHWAPAIEYLREKVQQKLGESLHSYWLRGSLARGTAVDGISDIDTFAIVHSDESLRWEEAVFKSQLQSQMQTQFPFAGDLELYCSAYHTNFAQHYPQLAMIIKTQSLCLIGEDIRPNLPSFRPGRAMMLNWRWVEEDLNDFLKKSEPKEEDVRAICKILIRVSFELVMERENKYTNDLYICCQAFERYYPEQATLIWELLSCFLNPKENKTRTRTLISEIGSFLVHEVNCYFLA